MKDWGAVDIPNLNDLRRSDAVGEAITRMADEVAMESKGKEFNDG